MSNVTLNSGFSSVLIACDNICDYIPIISTITNLFFGILEKLVLRCFTLNSLNENHYFSYIKDKSSLRCITLLVPFVGNILVGIYDLIYRKPKEENDLDFIARIQEKDLSDMSKSDYESNLILAQGMINSITNGLDSQIKDLEGTLNDLKSLTRPPKKINKHCNVIKTSFFEIEKQIIAFKSNKLDQHPRISAKLKKLADLRRSFTTWRYENYQKYLDHLISEVILEEAKGYYLSTNEENDPLFKPLETESSEQIMANVLNRIEDLAKSDKEYLIVELKILYLKFCTNHRVK